MAGRITIRAPGEGLETGGRPSGLPLGFSAREGLPRMGYGVLLLALIGWTVQGWPRDLRRFK
jgi:hypothetical protein